ncbi:DsbA family protein [Salibacterium salarium]|uniref:DsbA family protein n=1 Tax=Salibacterium salarium TaxID=284579 RepID=A0A3R9P2Z8_9BACI|nr:DsbA family protein [Salibacterium salarium]RSL29975.1 DsbA family protein [Salibacterium salarium]
MKSKILVVVTAVVMVGIAVFLFMGNGNTSVGEDTTFENHPEIERQPTIGEADAPVSVVEFGDYKCPSCKSWSEQVFPLLEDEYIVSGEASFTFINTLFHGEESERAALASESVWEQDPNSFWAFHELLFDNQPGPQFHDDVWVTTEELGTIADEVEGSIDAEQVMDDVENGTYADQVALDQSLVQEYNIELTPSILVNGTLIEDPFDWEAISAEIDAALEENS